MAGRKLPVLPVLATFPEADDLLYIVDVSDTSESPQGTSKQMERETLLDAGDFTLTPTVTAGTGAVDDFDFDFIKVGGKVLLTFFCRDFIVEVGEDTTSVELDLTGTVAEPSANFASGFLFTGSVSTSAYSQGAGTDIVQNCGISTVTGTKKVQIGLTLQANASLQYGTTIGGAITITI